MFVFQISGKVGEELKKALSAVPKKKPIDWDKVYKEREKALKYIKSNVKHEITEDNLTKVLYDLPKNRNFKENWLGAYLKAVKWTVENMKGRTLQYAGAMLFSICENEKFNLKYLDKYMDSVKWVAKNTEGKQTEYVMDKLASKNYLITPPPTAADAKKIAGKKMIATGL
ncbi:hypothetical protein JXB01_01435 [Candidatus Micrarchaeota archaeon]|nr:hypothetical protein [Candidatus Micrarchaeota archaeon]